MTPPVNLDTFVSNINLPFHFLTALEVVSSDPYQILLRGKTTLYNRFLQVRYGVTVEAAAAAGAEIQSITAHVEICTPEIIRMRLYTGMSDVIPPNPTPMVVAAFENRSFPVECIQNAGATTLRTSALALNFTPDLQDVHISSADGRTLLDLQPPPQPPQNDADVDYWLRYYRDTFPTGFVTDGKSTQTFFSARLRHDEHIYGFGEKFGALNKRGQNILLWNANAIGNTRKSTYKNIPFFMSSAGYGLFLNTPAPAKVHLGDTSFVNLSVHVQDRLMDVYFIAGDTFKDILARYTQLTGTPTLPPMWSFGLWASYNAFRHQNEVETLAERLRTEQIPCDVIHLDSETDPLGTGADVNFPPDRFPDPNTLMTMLHERGFHTSTTLPPYIVETSSLYSEGVSNEYFAHRADGTPLVLTGEFGNAALVDFSNPAAAEWIQHKIDRLLDIGIDALATNSGDNAPPEGYYLGGNGIMIRNLFTLFFQRAVFKRVSERRGGLIWGRSAYAGSQRYPVHWNGFTAARWEDLASGLRGGLSLGLSGIPFWGNDVGGFDGTPSPELYIRWAQAALFLSHVRLYGRTSRNPWDYGDEALRIFRKYAELRYELMPYIWSTANRCVETSQPFIRPLVLDWQDDLTTAYIDDQWMFGESILVAPILDETNRRKVYLPAGDWMDYWTSERLTGGRWLDIEASLDVLPMFLRAGAIIPMVDAHEIQSTITMKWTPLTLNIFAAADGNFTLYEGDNRFEYAVKRHENSVEITLGAARTTSIFLTGVPTGSRFTEDGRSIVATEARLGEETMNAVLDVEGRIIRAEWNKG